VLVVNGDDFGLTDGVNRGIVDAHTKGILTSASIFPNAPATEAGFALAARVPTLGVGIHLTLVDGTPVLPASQVPTLAPDGSFRATWVEFIAALFARRIALAEIERELTAQVDRVRSAGIRPTHLDGHKHVHTYPPVFAIVANIARRFAIPTVRIPRERPGLRLFLSSMLESRARRQAIENAALRSWADRDRLVLARQGLPPAPAFAGRVLTGLFTEDSLCRLIAACGPGVTELMMHPGYVDAALDVVRTRLRRERAGEVRLLTSASVIDAVRRSGIALRRHDTATHALESHAHVS
jgi:predicted glycoside hydrolase/deacetylase ChbG (UPF0249 family)